MDRNLIKNILWVLGTLAIMLLSYWFCRFFMFDFHGMKQYPMILFIVSLSILIISLFLKKHLLSIITILGYVGGFLIAFIFNSNGIDAGGGRTNNLWIIWTVTMLICIIIGIAIEVIIHQKKLK